MNGELYKLGISSVTDHWYLNMKARFDLCCITQNIYRISSDIRRIFSFQNNPKDLDPSYKTDLDL